jgi:hypothetical protein
LVAEQLSTWAIEALEKACNQSVLPCTIIAINQMPLGADSSTSVNGSCWDVNNQTQKWLNRLKNVKLGYDLEKLRSF